MRFLRTSTEVHSLEHQKCPGRRSIDYIVMADENIIQNGFYALELYSMITLSVLKTGDLY
jgi:hypothetical protein